MGWKEWRPKRLVCPHCGYDGTTHPDGPGRTSNCAPFYWVEDQPMTWPILGVIGKAPEGGHIIMDMNSELGADSDGSSARIHCQNCYEEFPVPDGVGKLDWTDEHGFMAAGGFDGVADLANPEPANLAPDRPCCCLVHDDPAVQCCPGWAHFDDPREIQRCDDCHNIGARNGLASDYEAIQAHRRQCRNCDHPEQQCRECGSPMSQCDEPGCFHCNNPHCGYTRSHR